MQKISLIVLSVMILASVLVAEKKSNKLKSSPSSKKIASNNKSAKTEVYHKKPAFSNQNIPAGRKTRRGSLCGDGHEDVWVQVGEVVDVDPGNPKQCLVDFVEEVVPAHPTPITLDWGPDQVLEERGVRLTIEEVEFVGAV